MLMQFGSARSDTLDRRLASSLAGVAGALNAAAFYAVGFFSANMTGNVSTLSDHIATGQWASALFYSFVVIAFVLGAAASTLLVNMGRRRNYLGIYALTILIEAGLLGCLGCASFWLPPPWDIPSIVLGLAFLMGLQNAVVTRISNARVRTTHVSGMATDIGIELGLLLDIVLKHEPRTDIGDVHARLRLHAETVFSFLAGGIVGVLLYRMIAGATLWVAATVLGIIAVSALRRVRLAANFTFPSSANDL